MPSYNVEYRPEVCGEDFRKIPRNLQKRILVTVWAIRHRKDVYEEAERRWILE